MSFLVFFCYLTDRKTIVCENPIHNVYLPFSSSSFFFSLSFVVNRGEQLNSLRTVVETFCLFVFFKSSLSSRKNSVCSKQETFFFLSSSSSFLSYWCYIHTYTHCFYFFWLLDAALVSLPHTLSLSLFFCCC